MEAPEKLLYPFYRANIHERRLAARVSRAAPLLAFLVFSFFVVLGVVRYISLLLWLCAATNVAMWLWIASTAMFAMWGARETMAQLKEAAREGGAHDALEGGVAHLIVLPNYREDEDMLKQTLESLVEAEGSRTFHVVLGMEGREGDAAREKAARLRDEFAGRLAGVYVTMHPANHVEEHLDGSIDAEVPGKASNLKFAVSRGYEECVKAGLPGAASVILTVADADCIFHPAYFRRVAQDFLALQRDAVPGSQGHPWVMWQAPQLPFRNYYESPVCSRAWGYVACVYEFGGVSGLAWGGHHMVFSGYSLPLQLALSAGPWDGDVIAEDHHAYIKCFYHSAWRSATAGGAGTPLLQVRPVMLPVKSTSVISDKGYWHSWMERWHQAKRHAQGVAELSYAVLVTWDALTTLPLSALSFPLLAQMAKVLVRLFCMHLLPIMQGTSMAVISVYWLWHHRRIPTCPDRIWLADTKREEFLCGLAGAWALVWPMVVPLSLVFLANVACIWVTFLAARGDAGKGVWASEDGRVPATWGSRLLTVVWLAFVDLAVFLGPLMLPYGFLVELIAFCSVCFYGNRIEYVTAAKAASLASAAAAQNDYGSAAQSESGCGGGGGFPAAPGEPDEEPPAPAAGRPAAEEPR